MDFGKLEKKKDFKTKNIEQAPKKLKIIKKKKTDLIRNWKFLSLRIEYYIISRQH